MQAKMLRRRYYILFVARDEDAHLRKIALPIKYVYGFVAAAIVGAFTIVGLAGSSCGEPTRAVFYEILALGDGAEPEKETEIIIGEPVDN